jgi:hypothetical protein
MQKDMYEAYCYLDNRQNVMESEPSNWMGQNVKAVNWSGLCARLVLSIRGLCYK